MKILDRLKNIFNSLEASKKKAILEGLDLGGKLAFPAAFTGIWAVETFIDPKKTFTVAACTFITCSASYMAGYKTLCSNVTRVKNSRQQEMDDLVRPDALTDQLVTAGSLVFTTSPAIATAIMHYAR